MEAQRAAESQYTLAELERKEMFRIEREDKGQLPVNEFGGITEGGGLWAGAGMDEAEGCMMKAVLQQQRM